MKKELEILLDALNGEEKDRASEALKNNGFFEIDKALKNISILFAHHSLAEMKKELISSIVDSPSPDLALNNMERVLSSLDDGINKDAIFTTENLKTLATLCGGSRFLTNIVLRRPALLEELFVDVRLDSTISFDDKLKELRENLKGVKNVESLQKVLRQFKAGQYLRIGLRDLSGLAPITEVMSEISDLASVTLQAAYEVSAEILKSENGTPFYKDDDGNEEEADFVILGMGKLGGRELNFSSDIDLIFLYTSDNGETKYIDQKEVVTVKKISLHQYFVKLGKMILKAMNDITEEGFVFRVDMDLRPEGPSGDLACSMRSAEIYYESWGQTWERAAMLKARPVAGKLELGDAFLKNIKPFKYRKFLDYTAIDEIRAMKKKIDASIARDNETMTNVKLGTGGIREIEFFIQALQLINGGKKAEIRENNSLTSLEKLEKAGLISSCEKSELASAYKFLRNVEHKLQIFEERQTHTLPDDEEKMTLLARRAGYRKKPLESFLKEHRKHTENVNRIYSSLFHEAANKLDEEQNPEIISLLEGSLNDSDALEKLSTYGFENPGRAMKNIRLLWNGPHFAHFTDKNRGVLRRVAPLIFTHIISSPEPSMALNNFEKFINAVGARATLYSLLAENHHVIKLLVGLFGTSEFLSKILLSYPETLDSLVSPGSSSPRKSEEEIKEELKSLLENVDYYEDKLDAMRRFRNVEILRIGINDIYGEIELKDVSDQLTYLADAALDIACSISMEKLVEKYGHPEIDSGAKKEDARMSVIAMGKLGGREMAYSSDLDIIFIYSGSGETRGKYRGKGGLKVIGNQEFYAKVAQGIISVLSIPTRGGYLFKVDTRLRPSGSSGTLVASFDSFRDYHRNKSQVWERQALTKARVVAGDLDFGSEVMSLIEERIYTVPENDDLAFEIVRIRSRMEFELAKESDGIYNVKTGKGGLVDIEFLVQYLLLKYGRLDNSLRSANTQEALGMLHSNNLIEETDYTVLHSAYNFFRKIENALRIVRDQSVSKLDTRSSDFDKLAKRLGYKSDELRDNYKGLTGKVRTIYNSYLTISE